MVSTGIVSYGTYIPKFRIKVEEIARIWGEVPENIKAGLGVQQKSVPDIDEDTATISVECAREAVERGKINPKKIGAIFVGSESHPYVVKPTATIVGSAIGCGNFFHAADFEFACKAGTAGIQTCMAMVKSGMIEYGLAIGADTSQSAPGDPLEYSASAGGSAFIIGKENLIAEFEDTLSFTSDTPDFWRREGQPYPSHGGRFTGLPAYFRHVVSAAKEIMERNGYRPSDFAYAVFHMPNGKFPVRASRMLGFSREQTEQGLVVRRVGNTYSGSSLLGFSAVLDVAKAGDKILLVSFGSGAGSDAFIVNVTDAIESFPREPKVWDKIESGVYVDYSRYLKLRRKIKMK
ncbi:hydroxymethylglutaryl-CoA synthase [Archaeoglobus sulfaticallidus PM70-1]|uniref:Hydroxymethylglutaryl-CoA synthase n=1 Tax=Archaeoglobus sulfaticallidus PM70-1 TaxID=387631 RepID=N0BJR4_9EURY|nr:hydroxymethylglutaryl-CoA synthase [Archaeoglobus sulfaticallidus]AGK60741.1 hydroxymethylglutaryl-CoA synthase [Archaeoglobus sulfaticallidus PM70-1]